jgi:chemotaxis protein histidine kinase CheA
VALTSAARATPGYAVVLDTGTRRLALGVDTLLGSAELVVKPLDGSFPRFPFVTGAALLADASVSLIVDCRALGEGERAPRGPARRAVHE